MPRAFRPRPADWCSPPRRSISTPPSSPLSRWRARRRSKHSAKLVRLGEGLARGAEALRVLAPRHAKVRQQIHDLLQSALPLDSPRFEAKAALFRAWTSTAARPAGRLLSRSGRKNSTSETNWPWANSSPLAGDRPERYPPAALSDRRARRRGRRAGTDPGLRQTGRDAARRAAREKSAGRPYQSFRRGEIAGRGLAGGSGLAGGPHGGQAAIAARRNMRELLQVDDSRDKCAKMALCPI